MSRFPNELAAALVGTFLRDDPRDAIWVCHGTAQIIRTKVQKQSPEQLNFRT
jgi:hypothetical protein